MATSEAGRSAAPDGVPLGAVLFAVFLALLMAGYAWSVVDASRRLTDWILIVPVTAVGVAALAVAVLEDVRAGRSALPEAHGDARTGAGLVVLVLAYAGSAPWLGFDVGTALFVAAALALQGERRVRVVVPMALVTALLLAWLFRRGMNVPIPTLLV